MARGEEARHAAALADADVLHHLCPALGAVAPPELHPVEAVVVGTGEEAAGAVASGEPVCETTCADYLAAALARKRRTSSRCSVWTTPGAALSTAWHCKPWGSSGTHLRT